MGRLTLQLFGGLRTCREGGAGVALAGRKAQALLAYLALNPRQRCTRDRLAALLWSDRGEEQARQSLRQAVRCLHKALDGDGAAILVSDGDRLTLDPEAVAVDVQDFERLSAADTREALEQARALYAGDLLEGVDVRSEGFEEWLAAERARLRDLAADALQRLTKMYVDSGEWDAALRAGQELLALDPLREEGHRILMRVYDGTGRRTLALRQFRVCEEALRRELDTAPAPETVRLHSEIRARNGEMAGSAGEGKAAAGEEPRPQVREPARPQRAERKLAAILAADIAGYGRLMGADEEGTIARIKALRRELIDPKIEEHRGRIVKTTGDGILIEFPSVVEAVRCAVEVQRGMVDRNADLPPDRRIEFRAGVNLGDIIVEGKDIYGDGVNIAARLEALAEPGGVCVSRAVRDHIRDRLPYEFADLGEQAVKNIARPVRVFGLAAAAIAALPEIAAAPPAPSPRRPTLWMYAAAAVIVVAAIGAGVWRAGLISGHQATGPSASAPAAPHLSIVVLPFVNLSNDPDQDYFADGITNNLTTDVSYIEDSFVIASNTAFTYRGKTVDAKQIGRELGVRYVLEGSVQRSANQIRVNAQLIDAETGSYLWAESFDRERGDLFAIEDEITKRITQTVHLQLLNIEGQRAERRSTSADAMDYIMRAEAVWQRPISKDNYRELAELYARALQLDEHLPRTLTGMADVLSSRVLDEFSDAPEDDLRRADELVSRALAVDPNYYYAHRIKGNILRIRKRYEEAVVEYEADIALNPMEVRGRSHLARVKILIGEPAEAIPLSEQAMRISPRHPFIGVMQYRLGLANLLAGNTDEAIRWYEKALQTDAVFSLGTTSADAYLQLGAALGLKGDKTAAQAALAEAVKRQPEYTTIAKVRSYHFPDQSDRPKFVELQERTLIEGLRKAGMPEDTPVPQAAGSSASAPVTPRLAIVVLPFVNLSNDPDQEYFADGITDNLTTDLSRISGSFVIARSSAFTYKGKAADVKQIGRELGVRYILEGSVQRSANHIVINAQLIDAETGSHLWAESFDRERGDLFAIEDEITRRIARSLSVQLINIEAQRAERRSTSSDAMDYIMRGMALLQRPPSKAVYQEAEDMFDRALQLDPHLLAAQTGLANTLSGRFLDEFSDNPEDDLQRADGLIATVLTTDPNYFYAHYVHAQILRAQKHFEQAIEEYEIALTRDRNNARALSHLARAKILIGEPAEAIPLLEQAMRISPRDPSIGYMHYRLGLANFLLGNTDEAIRWYEKAVLTYYSPADAYRDLAAALALKGDKTAAQAALAEAIKRQPEYATIAKVRSRYLSDRPKFVELRERTVIAGLRKAGMPEQEAGTGTIPVDNAGLHKAGMPEDTPSLDAQVWDVIRSSTNPADYKAYLRIFPSGPVADLVRERLRTLAPSRQPPASAASRISAAPAPKPEQNAVATRTVPPPVPAPEPPASTDASVSTAPIAAPQQQLASAAPTDAAALAPAPEQQAMIAPDASKSVTSPGLPGAPYDGEWKGVVLGGAICPTGPCRWDVKATVAKNAVSGKGESQKGNVELSGTISDDGSFAGTFGDAPITGRFDEDRFKGVIVSGTLSVGYGGALILERVK